MATLKFIFYSWFCFIFFNCNTKSNKADKSQDKESAIQQKDSAQSLPKNNTAELKYDLTIPTKTWQLPEQLVEVSGNAWISADHLLLIEDLHPNLYFLKLNDKTATLEKSMPFAETDKEKIDIEDVAYVDNTIYTLWSHGVLFKITNWQQTPKVDRINTGLSKDNNTEGLCYDPVSKFLLIACKDDAGVADGKKSDKAVYQFDVNKQSLVQPPFLIIHKKDFETLTGDKLSFNPSAIAIHPITHDIYILTTRDNKGMAVYSYQGSLKSYQPIQKELMPQPEGICFSPEGKLYISSEGKKGEAGNLFEFDPKN